MNIPLDHRSPVPVFHQLAEALRYRIATGELSTGTVLPPLRRAGRLWGVNLHTVRRAYAELARLGLVLTRTPAGTEVIRNAVKDETEPGSAGRRQFLEQVVQEARLRHGLDVEELIDLLARTGTPEALPEVSVVECSTTQSADLAEQLARRWRVKARGWVLDRGEPPAGPVVGTYFHFNDIRLRWPERLPHIHFVPIAPEASLAGTLSRGRPPSRKLTVHLCERDEAMARNIGADLVRILPAKQFRLATRIVSRAEDALDGPASAGPLLLSPRMWGELPPRLRKDPRVHQVRYVFDSQALEALGRAQRWEAA
jgi:DNA-binding transcriptional regulator YhcF (GntR family)